MGGGQLLFLVDILQRFIDFAQFGGEGRKVSAHVCGHLLSTMNTGIFIDVGSDSFGY